MNKIKYFLLSFVGILLFTALSTAGEEKLYYIAPTEIPNVTREMKTAGFWISRLPKPDKLIMNARSIKKFNRHIQDDLKLTKDLATLPDPYDGNHWKEQILAQLDQYKSKNYFGADGQPATAEFFAPMTLNMGLDNVQAPIVLQYGFITRFSDQRFLPTHAGLYAIAGDIDFDELQNSDLDLGTPVVILHTSADKKWFYVLSTISDGWVVAENVATCPFSEFREHYAEIQKIVITDKKADIYLDQELTRQLDHARMGAMLSTGGKDLPSIHLIAVPTRHSTGEVLWRTAYVKKSQAAYGALPLTPRNVLEQAFKLLNEPYGWGGMHGEQDCSRFLAEVFATFGLILPRDSKDQARVGERLAEFKEGTLASQKLSILEQLFAGEIILPMKGHIMLYLGLANGRPYAIHAVWGYREGSSNGDVVRVINRVAVSDLYLGEGSKKGSLLERLNAIVSLRNP